MDKRFSYLLKNRVRRLLFIILVGTMVYAVLGMINAPTDAVSPSGETYHILVKADYVQILIKGLLGLVVMTLPGLIEARQRVDLPEVLEILYFVFLFMAIFLGSIRNFYERVPHWDTVLHFFSSLMLGFFGFYLVAMLNSSKRVPLYMTPLFVAFFSFCFTMMIGVLWEVYEFVIDGAFIQNMQRFTLEDGTLLLGRAALNDTMMDFVVNGVGALAVSVWGYGHLKRKGLLPGMKDFWTARDE